jgi:hypothetical protein
MMKAQRASDRSVQNATLAQQQTVVDDESHNFRFAEQSANGKNGTIFTVFHVKESQMDIQKRVIASKFPFLYNSANRVADGGIYQYVHMSFVAVSYVYLHSYHALLLLGASSRSPFALSGTTA